MNRNNPYNPEKLPPKKLPKTFAPRVVPPKVSSSQFTFDVEKTFKELQKLLFQKHEDYGPKNISESPGGPLNGLRVRMHDKLARINNLIDNNSNPKNESLEDSFKDMANYAIIGLLVLRKQWDNKSNDTKLNSMMELWNRDKR